ncbi:hypothetical protein [Achromobacter sp. GbtcB20]|uniref:hypothetical protein n=1 Tax=Achromobacter sp. GbtcB20 TaxID=2824765 RepID=UPI00187B8075|nr:hypothetical protein [Achromobacter sp. GbtcB20]
MLNFGDQFTNKETRKVRVPRSVERGLALAAAGHARKVRGQDDIAIVSTAPKLRQSKRQHESRNVQ